MCQRLPPAPLERSAYDPTRLKAHQAALVELALLALSDEDFKAAQPEHTRKIKANQAAVTGVSWIDELEKERFQT